MPHKKSIVLIGGGGHCKSVLDAAIRTEEYSEIVITDYAMPAGSSIGGFAVVGTDDVLPRLFERGITHGFITVGSIKSSYKRRTIYDSAKNIGFCFPVIADPSAIIAEGTTIGQGVFIGKNSVINSDSHIGDFAIINTGCIIEHECRIGAFAHIAVGAAVCGGVEIGDNVFVGANATIIQGVKIGMNTIIGAGSIILKDVIPNSRIVGVWR